MTPSTTLFFREALKEFTGITVIAFTDPILALEHFQKYDYAYVLVISDYKMAAFNGMEFLKKIKEYNRFVRTILITAAFRMDDKVFNENGKKKIINAFLPENRVLQSCRPRTYSKIFLEISNFIQSTFSASRCNKILTIKQLTDYCTHRMC